MAITPEACVEVIYPSGAVMFLGFSLDNSIAFLYASIMERMNYGDIIISCEHRTLSKYDNDSTIRNFVNTKNVMRVTVRTLKANLYIGENPVYSKFNYAIDKGDAFYAFTRMFDDFNGAFEGKIVIGKNRYVYRPPKGKRVLPWIALDGNIYYILAGKKQALEDVLIPDDDCELVGMTIVEKKTRTDRIDASMTLSKSASVRVLEDACLRSGK